MCPQDAMRSVTKQAVKEARLREIKDELLNSEKLKVIPPRLRFPAGSGLPEGRRAAPWGYAGSVGWVPGAASPP